MPRARRRRCRRLSRAWTPSRPSRARLRGSLRTCLTRPGRRSAWRLLATRVGRAASRSRSRRPAATLLMWRVWLRTMRAASLTLRAPTTTAMTSAPSRFWRARLATRAPRLHHGPTAAMPTTAIVVRQRPAATRSRSSQTAAACACRPCGRTATLARMRTTSSPISSRRPTPRASSSTSLLSRHAETPTAPTPGRSSLPGAAARTPRAATSASPRARAARTTAGASAPRRARTACPPLAPVISPRPPCATASTRRLPTRRARASASLRRSRTALSSPAEPFSNSKCMVSTNGGRSWAVSGERVAGDRAAIVGAVASATGPKVLYATSGTIGRPAGAPSTSADRCLLLVDAGADVHADEQLVPPGYKRHVPGTRQFLESMTASVDKGDAPPTAIDVTDTAGQHSTIGISPRGVLWKMGDAWRMRGAWVCGEEDTPSCPSTA
eukprot:Opistho-1_new@82639